MTRSEAKAAGLPYYDEGRHPCVLNHQPIKRWVSTGKCFWCARDYERERRRADAANRTALTKEWRKLNPDKVREGNAQRDPAMLRAISRRWYYSDPTHALAVAAASRAKRKMAAGRFTKADIAEIMKLQGGKCAYCAKSVLKKRHIDHIMPIALGGTNQRANLQILCPSCNRHKHSAHPIDFARSLGRLI
jgi:5-methylcytosine-specific restriction endonuclease McrA